jgi:DNA polymerase III subunit delta'
MAFADFPEQQQAVGLLQRSLDRGRLSHAYLFAGAAMSELEGVARTLAKTLNCVSPPTRGASGLPLESCDQCSNCRRVGDDNHPDVYWVRPEAKSRVIIIEQIRDLLATIYLKPTESQHKVAIIVAADRLTIQAANAFLKTLEEPPTRSVLLLLSIEPERLLDTIVSRCIRLTFAGEGRHHITAGQQDWVSAFAEMAARQSKGLMGRYQLLGVLLEKLGVLKSEIETTLTARSPLERHDDVDARLREKWEDELTAAIEAEYRLQRGEILLALEWWLRDVWLHTLSAGKEFVAFPKLVAAADAVARRISGEDAAENLKAIEDTQRLLGSNVQEALALEVGLLRLKL